MQNEKRIVYFDGVCGLCNHFVDFLIARDSKDRLRFSPLQSSFAQGRLPNRLVSADMETVVLEYQGKFFERSEAALRSLIALGGGYQVLAVFLLLPASLRDGIYNFVARRRYAWFSRQDQCRLPTKEEMAKFIV